MSSLGRGSVTKPSLFLLLEILGQLSTLGYNDESVRTTFHLSGFIVSFLGSHVSRDIDWSSAFKPVGRNDAYFGNTCGFGLSVGASEQLLSVVIGISLLV
ncbi:hypothetical protein BU16DRAFT_99500 [Lophium mytilinum]|uniref:Peptidase S54 rhomboid domain-containing protein n=1 Tax=Lophium mytilinum TaxID=390894 RepID=A0A6A6QKP0_9PEZI|nr:hypothetical protein BU16DRAFT_99500 [Lophium mytilinum]